MSRTIIVIPCYNEARRLEGSRFLEVVDGDPRTDILFVDDGSRDDTLERIRKLSAERPGRIACCVLPVNEGKAEAVRRGVQAALRRHPEYVGFWDADLATPLDEIGRFRAVLDRRPELQLVIGSRTRLLGRRIERKRMRTLLGRLFATVASRAVKLPVFDTQCGAKLFRANAETERLFAEPFLSRWIFDVELFARFVSDRRRNGGRESRESVYELPLDQWRDVAGSKLRSSDFLKAIGELAAIRWRYFHAREPSPRFAPRASGPVLELPAEWRADRKAA